MAGHVKRRPGTDSWRARFPDPLRGGTAQIERTFTKAKGGKAAAEAWLDSVRNSARTGTYIDPNQGKRTFAAVAEEYRTTWADLEPRTKAGYDHILRKHLLPRFGNAPVANITPDAIQRFVNELAKTRARNTVRRITTVLNATLNVAVNRRYIATNPAATTKLPKRITNPERMTFLTPEEVRQLAEAMPAHYKTATYVAAYMGLRAGELWALRRKDVDLLTGTLHVRQALKEINGAPTSTEHIQAHERGLIFGPPKSQASRRSLALPAPIRTLLTEHLASFLPGGASADALIFTTPGGNPVRHGLFYRRVFRPAVKRALPPSKHALRWHDLRHTAASLSLAVSPNLHLVKERLGHEDIRTTINTYGHLLPSVEAALADGLGALFAAAETPPTATPSATNVVPLNQRA